MRDLYEFVDKHRQTFVQELREFIRQPGISTENTGIRETASWLAERMKENGLDDVRTYETPRHPIIVGTAGREAKSTLLVYGHYDVQPPGDRRSWQVDPFSAEVVGDRIVGRGTCDMKNNLMACLHAVRAMLECRKSMPIKLSFLFEGEEEIGSPSLKPFIEEHKAELSACDSILCAEGGESKTGQGLLVCGYKGIVYLELYVKSATGTEVHSSYAGIMSNPAWRLVSALRSLKEEERVLIPHFYDEVKGPSLKEKMKYGLARLAVSKEKLEQAFDLKIRDELSVSDALLEVFYKPTLNIDGLYSGFTPKGEVKTIVPESAWAKIDIRLVPGQDPEAVLENLRKHLLGLGFSDIGVEKLGFGLPAYRVDPDERIVQVVGKALKEVVSKKIMMIPIAPGSGAMVWLPLILRKPMASAGSGAGYMAHRPNEFITVEQYIRGIKLFATIYNSFGS